MNPRTLLGVAFALSSAACSSGGSSSSNAPVIDTLSVPSTFDVVPCGDGGTGLSGCSSGVEYVVQGTLAFHDDGAEVTQIHLKVPAYGLDQTQDMTGAATQASAQVVIGFVASTPIASGTVVEMDVSVIDAAGAESNVEVEHVGVP